MTVDLSLTLVTCNVVYSSEKKKWNYIYCLLISKYAQENGPLLTHVYHSSEQILLLEIYRK